MAKIVVIDIGDDHRRYILPAALELHGHTVTIVTSLQRVELVLNDERPQLIIVVESNAWPSLLLLEQLANNGVLTPIIVLTDSEDGGYVQLFNETGFSALSLPSICPQEADALLTLKSNYAALMALITQGLDPQR